MQFLMERNRIEPIAVSDPESDCGALLNRAKKRLATANAALVGEDNEGAFANAYDVYRMGADCLLLRQGLRATGGEGSHMAVEDAVAAQFGDAVKEYAKPLFQRFRQGRHASQYFDPSLPEKTQDDARWAVETAERALRGVEDVLASGGLGLYG